MIKCKRILTLSLLCFLNSISFGAVVNWDGDGTTDNWSDAKNWDNDMLPTFIDDVVIRNAKVNMDISASILSLTIEEESELTINEQLTINGAGAQGILVDKSTILNNGTITIPTFTGHGIVNTNASNFMNSGTIQIFNILNGSGIVNEADWINNGKIEMASTDLNALNNSDNFENNDTLNVNALVGNDVDAIYNTGNFTNINKGVIQVSNVSGEDSNAIESTNQFNNQGKINISDIGYTGIEHSSNSFTNDGEINIQSASRFGMLVRGNGLLVNRSSGILNITEINEDATLNAKGLVISNSGSCSNIGLMKISDITSTNSEGISCGNLTNRGTIDISGIFFTSIFCNSSSEGISNFGSIEISNNGPVKPSALGINNFRGTITNQSTGTISIGGMSRINGISNTGTITNLGFINMINLKTAILNSDEFTTFSNQRIVNIDSTFGGINNLELALFENFDSISITNLLVGPASGISNLTRAKFENNASGVIVINKSVDFLIQGIFNSDLAQFTNDGKISISEINASGFVNILNGVTTLNSNSELAISSCSDSYVKNQNAPFTINQNSLLKIDFSSGGTPLEIDEQFTVHGIIEVEP